MDKRAGQRRALGCGLAAFVWFCLTLAQLAHAATVAGATPGQFTVTEQGAATYSLPIQVPPGTAGMEPKLALAYNSQAGNGLLGMGWSLSGLSIITRCPRTLAQDGVRGGVNYDANDRFCLDGQRLIAIEGGSYGAEGTEYRTERDSFSKVISYGVAGTGPAWFKVWTKSGLVMEYGNTAEARIEAQGKTSARLWALNKVSDSKGNYFTVAYTEDTANGDFYPSRIDYTGNAGAGVTPYASVRFTYAARPDVVPAYWAGSKVQTAMRLTNVRTYSLESLVRDYQLAYDQSGATGRSRVRSVTECAADGNCLAPVQVAWPEGTNAFVNKGTAISSAYADWANAGDRIRPMDVNGDGLQDIVLGPDGGGHWYVLRSTGTSFVNEGAWITGAYGSWDATPERIRPMDVNGDGLMDFVIGPDASGNWFVLRSTGTSFVNDGAWITGVHGGWAGAPERIRAVDMNGDGKQDILIGPSADGQWFVLRSTGTTFIADTAWITGAYGNWDTSANRIRPMDVNGDGLTDVVIGPDTGGNWYVLRSTGTSFVNDGAWISGAYGNWETAPASIRPMDVNGDGLTDLVIGPDLPGNWYVLRSTGTAFANDGAWITGAYGGWMWVWPWPWTANRIRPMAFNGDGLPDIVLGPDYSGQWSRLEGTAAADRVSAITDSLGAATAITYQPLTNGAVYTKGTGSVYPVMDLQMPMYVVSSVQHPNAVAGGHTTANYQYGALRADFTGRGLLGFGWVQASQTESGITVRTDYRQDWPYVGLPAQVKKTQANGAQLSLATHAYACFDPQDSSACTVALGKRYFPYVSETVESGWDLNGTALPTATSRYWYGQRGNPITVQVTTSDGVSKLTQNSYANDLTNWYLGRLTRSTVTSGGLTRTSAFDYDAVTGLLTKEIIEPDGSHSCLVTQYTHDAFGNKASATTRNCNGSAGSVPAENSEAPAPTGPALFEARTTSTQYDAQGRFAVAATNALGHVETRVFDARFGTVTSLTGPNGLTTTWTYDAFGRKQQENRADGTVSTWTYYLCIDVGDCPADGQYRVVITATGKPAVTPTYDALNREIRSRRLGFDGITIIRKDTDYDARGRVARVSRPYYAGDTIHWTTYAYDDLNRVTSETIPGGTVTSHSYNGLITTTTVTPQQGGPQTRRTVRNSQGQVVSVTDALNNTITYQYGPFGNLVQTTDPQGNQSVLAYDLRGRKTGMADPDMGSWTYEYNGLGELTYQTDAKGQPTTLAYDKLGRMVTRTEPDLVSTWTYDTCTKGVGKLCQVSADNGYQRTHGYDGFGRPQTTSVTLQGTTHSLSTAYDASGRVASLTWPTGFAVSYTYTAKGYLKEIRKSADAALLWQATQLSATGRVLNETLGNGLLTARSYDVMDRLTDISSGAGTGTVHHHGYSYDGLGNLTQRVDHTQNVTENFAYDELNRLTMASGPNLATRTLEYNAIGNIAYKSDVGSYTYPAAGQPRPHAVTQVAGAMNASYSYDANGNLFSGNGKTLSYMSFNMPATITTSNYSYTYTYGAGHQRVRLVTVRPDDTITSLYLHPSGGGQLLYEQETRQSNGSQEHKHYVMAGDELVGVYVTKSAGAPEMRYYHHDHLGSVAAITNEAGAVIERLAYEAFGERRYSNGTAQDRASPLIGITTDRGFTSHEHLDELNLIHMNGRVYDPALGRFMTPDPYIQSPGNLQSYNRYSYVLNNPLRLTDPTGYSFWTSVRDIVVRVVAAVADAYGCAGYCSAAVGAYQGYRQGGVQGGVIGGIAGYAGYQMGVNYPLTDGPTGSIIWGNVGVQVAVNGTIGCASAASAGGNCGRGALVGSVGTVGAAYGFLGSIIAGCAAGRVSGGSCSEGAFYALGTYAVTSAVGYAIESQRAGASRAEDSVLLSDAAEGARNRQYVPEDRYVSALSVVFETSPDAIREVSITEFSDFADQHRAVAVTRMNAIYLSGSGEAFFADPTLTLHEYYHVLRQWNTGELTEWRYIGEWIRQGFNYDRIKYEVQAREFANQNAQRYRSILEQRK